MNVESDSYYTIKQRATHEIKIKSSRFIGYSETIKTSESAETFIK